jgi:hypothetical protein
MRRGLGQRLVDVELNVWASLLNKYRISLV